MMKSFTDSTIRPAVLCCRALPADTRPLSGAGIMLVAMLPLFAMSSAAPAATLTLTSGNMPILTDAGGETFTGDVTLTGDLTVRVGAVEYLIVGGGGGGGNAATNNRAHGGNGGQVLNNVLNLTDNSNKTVTIGGGGAAAGSQNSTGGTGGSSSFAGITATGGTGGGPTGGNAAGANGPTSSITGTSTNYGGGGGDGRNDGLNTWAGGLGGGGRGARHAGNSSNDLVAVAGTANTGGGGGGSVRAARFLAAAGGGSGVVIVRYYGQTDVANGGTETASGTVFRYHRFTGAGNLSGLTDPTLQTAIFSGNISGGFGLNKQALGTLVLEGNNTYTGTTNVTAGTLLLNGTHTGGGLYTVGTGTSFSGSGSTESAVSVFGTISPGNSIESLGTGDLALEIGSNFEYQINTDTIAADLLYGSVDGTTLDIIGSPTLNLIDLGSGSFLANGTKFTLIAYDGLWNGGTFNGYADDSEFFFAGNLWLINYNDAASGVNFKSDAQLFGTSFVTITAIVVPEPESFALGLLGLAGVGLLLRRRHSALRSNV